MGKHVHDLLGLACGKTMHRTRHTYLTNHKYIDDMQAALEVVLGDLTDASMVRRAVADCQVVFHLGALIAIPYSYQAPHHFIDTNVISTLNVVPLSVSLFVFQSTA
jgi:nucleoside-diphosphate-sugar epimerase